MSEKQSSTLTGMSFSQFLFSHIWFASLNVRIIIASVVLTGLSVFQSHKKTDRCN